MNNMKLNRRASSWRGDELEMCGWRKGDERPAEYTWEGAVYSVTSNGGIESNIDSLRKIVAAILASMPPDQALTAINSVSDYDFVPPPGAPDEQQ